MDTMEESVDDLMLMLMKDDETKFNHGYRDGTVQELRRNTMFMRMMGIARAAEPVSYTHLTLPTIYSV